MLATTRYWFVFIGDGKRFATATIQAALMIAAEFARLARNPFGRLFDALVDARFAPEETHAIRSTAGCFRWR
jgi:hypothetical protein